jgi:hypothetical protein
VRPNAPSWRGRKSGAWTGARGLEALIGPSLFRKGERDVVALRPASRRSSVPPGGTGHEIRSGSGDVILRFRVAMSHGTRLRKYGKCILVIYSMTNLPVFEYTFPARRLGALRWSGNPASDRGTCSGTTEPPHQGEGEEERDGDRFPQEQ